MSPNDFNAVLSAISDEEEIKTKGEKEMNLSKIAGMVARRAAVEVQAIEFDSEKQMKDYLKKHPGADKSKHHVKKQEKNTPAKQDVGVQKKILEKQFSDLEKKDDELQSRAEKFWESTADKALGFALGEKEAFKLWDTVNEKLPSRPSKSQWFRAWEPHMKDVLATTGMASYNDDEEVEPDDENLFWDIVGAVAESRNYHEFASGSGDHWTDGLSRVHMNHLDDARDLAEDFFKQVDQKMEIRKKLKSLEESAPSTQAPKQKAPVKVKTNVNPKMKPILEKNGLADDDTEVAEITVFKKTLGERGKGRSPAQLKADFIKMMNPASYDSPEAFKKAQERIKNMSPNDFDAVLSAISDEEEEIKTSSERRSRMNERTMMARVARELVLVAKMLEATPPWESITDNIDVRKRNIEIQKSLTAFAPKLMSMIRKKVASELGVQSSALKREYSAYLTLIDLERNANKYHYYAIFGRKNEDGQVMYSSWNCSGRIGIVERAYNLTQKALRVTETPKWTDALRAVEAHRKPKERKGYEVTHFVRK